jgi:hypothetical protein
MTVRFEMSASMKRYFLDRQEVARQIGRANQRALIRAAAFIRRRARSSLRRRRRPSQPGQPPSVHSTNNVATLKNIQFAYDPQSQALVIGPVALTGGQSNFGPQLAGQTVPQVMEFGATVKMREARVGRSWRNRPRRVRSGQPIRVRRVKYQPRPFMGPAFQAEAGNVPSAWIGTVG